MHTVGRVATPLTAPMGIPERIVLYIDSGTISAVSSGETMTLRAKAIKLGHYRIVRTDEDTGVSSIISRSDMASSLPI